MKKANSLKCAQTGHFVLRNNKCSPEMSNQVKGVLVDESCYLDIDSIVKTPVSKQEALLYGHRLNLLLPTKKQMRLLEKHLSTINNSLLSIGRGDCLLLGSMLKEFWTRCEKSTGSDERRNVLFLAPL